MKKIVYALLIACHWLAFPLQNSARPFQPAPAAHKPPGNEAHKKRYKIKYGETLTGIARKMGMKLADLRRLNQLKDADQVREGQEIWVIDAKGLLPATVSAPQAAPAAALPAEGFHAVREGEVLSRIAQKYGLRVDSLMKWNQLAAANQMKAGQKLWLLPAHKRPKTEVVAILPPTLDGFFKTSGKKVSERGMGAMIVGVDSPLKVALHRDAPIGSVIRVYNEASRASVLAKVVGRIPDIDSESKVVVKLSKAACREIGVVNEHFPVEVNYEK